MFDCNEANYDLAVRKTHKYRDGWSHLDEFETVGSFSILKSGELNDTSSESDGGTLVRIVQVKRTEETSDEVVENALIATFSYSNCQHDYDCCGCKTYYVDSALKKSQDDDIWLVLVNYYENY